mmetsp:Transcript_64533/g.106868  ORF Transcript_64533/g.106868 Transcript_64533/m.106868 type:complete len:380 (-) Transcript_64533:305-1444(-)
MATRVLCCGDSLTAGFYGSHTHYTPYSAQLSAHLGVPVDQIGRSGWRADEMVNNMTNTMCIDVFRQHGPGLAVQLAAKKYDICIIMAGTNDLAANRSAETILSDVISLHAYCHSQGLRTIALPIPESRQVNEHTTFTPPGAVRANCNRMLQQWAATQQGQVLFVDMVRQVRYSDVDGNWSTDGLHMSQQGYANFGHRLGCVIKSWALGSGALSVKAQYTKTRRPSTDAKAKARANTKAKDAASSNTAAARPPAPKLALKNISNQPTTTKAQAKETPSPTLTLGGLWTPKVLSSTPEVLTPEGMTPELMTPHLSPRTGTIQSMWTHQSSLTSEWPAGVMTMENMVGGLSSFPQITPSSVLGASPIVTTTYGASYPLMSVM